MKKVHFVLDEAGSINHMDALDDAVDKLRGYGVHLIYLLQSLAQLKKLAPDGQDQTILSNTSQVFVGVNDPQTSQYVSTRLGEETVVVDNGGSSTGQSVQSPSGAGQGSSSYSQNQNSGWGQQVRRLLKPEEVEGLSPRIALVLTPGIPPLWTTTVRYYEESFGPPSADDRRRAQARIKRECVAMLAAAILVSLGTLALIHQYSGSHRPVVPHHRTMSREALRYTMDEFDRYDNLKEPDHVLPSQTSAPLVSRPSGTQRSRSGERYSRPWNRSRTDAAPAATNLRAAKQ